jgi:hypothetical protein
MTSSPDSAGSRFFYSPIHFSDLVRRFTWRSICFPRALSIEKQIIWKDVTIHWRLPFAGAAENPQGFCAVSTANSFPKMLCSALRGKLLRQRNVN